VPTEADAIDCKQARELLPPHVDRELGVSESVALAHHLEGCTECRQQLAEQVALAGIVKARANYFPAPDVLTDRITAAAAQG